MKYAQTDTQIHTQNYKYYIDIHIIAFNRHIYTYTNQNKRRGQRPNESQKAVITDMMKSMGEIASKTWLVV